MPYTRMKRIFLQGLLWLYLLSFGYMALSLDNPGFLDFDNLPDTNFSCVGKVIGGYYADLETNCQMFHVCTIGQLDEPMDIRFLCLNGTVFDQETRVCERIDEVDCSKSEQFYSLNLELYGNSQPAILEESPETDQPQPLLIKSTTPSTTTTTSTTTPRPTLKATRQPYYTTVAPPTITTANVNNNNNNNHHFPIVNANSPDIRFNPEEINISLNPGAPPNIRTKPLIYQQQLSYTSENNINKGVVTTVLPTTQKPKSIVSYGLTHPGNQQQQQQQHQSVTPTDINFGFTFRQQEEQQQTEYHTEPQHNYHYQANLANFRPSFLQHKSQFRPTTYRSEFTPTTLRNRYQQPKPTTTMRAHYLQSLKPPPQIHPHHYQLRTEKPQRLQLPLPILPTITPLTFSSPAPFTLPRHIETKRYTKEHPSPPRIIISASASVSDASGRRLNYSLGQIGAAHILEQPPNSYDEYKDEDVGLDPFYHDVPKVDNNKRRNRNKRSVNVKHSDIIRSEQEAVDVLKFLFDWYKNHEQSTVISIPVSPKVITEINEELVEKQTYNDSELFLGKSKFNIVSDLNLSQEREKTRKSGRRRGSRRFTPPVTEETTLERILSSTTTKTVEEPENVEMSRNNGQKPESTIDEQYTIFEDVNLNIGESGKSFDRIDKIGEETKTNEETVNIDTDNPIVQVTTEEIVKDIDENVTETTTITEETTVENTESPILSNTEHNLEDLGTTINTTIEDITTDNIEIDTVSPETTEESLPITTTTRRTSRRIRGRRKFKTPDAPTLQVSSTTTEGIVEIPENHTNLDQEIPGKKTFEDNTVPNDKKFVLEVNGSTMLVDHTVNYNNLTRLLDSSTSTTTITPTTTTTTIEETITIATVTTPLNLIESQEIDVTPLETTTETTIVTTDNDLVTTIFSEVPTTIVEQTTTPIVEETTITTTTEEPTTITIKPEIETTTVTETTTTMTTIPTTTTKLKYNQRRTFSRTGSPRRPYGRHRFSSNDITSKTTTTEQPSTTEQHKPFIFNCFDKDLNKFYPDPRDCRLFHYCTNGFSRNQLLDMKFVCDFNTYFDEERLICSRQLPLRCV